MALKEIDESQLLNLQAVERAVNSMLAHPEARKQLLRARKTADPNAVIPEIDAAEPINAQMGEFKKLMDEQRAALAEEKAARERMIAEDKAARDAERLAHEQDARQRAFQDSWERQKIVLRGQGWRDAGIAEIEKHAQERGIPDLEIAAAHWEKLHPPEAPAQPNGAGSWGFFDQGEDDGAFVKAMIESKGEDESALSREVNAALSEVRSQQVLRR